MTCAMTRTAGRTAAVAGLVLALAAGSATAADLLSHRAIYDLTLSRAEASTSLVDATGRLVFNIEGSECEGYTVDFRNVTRVVDREGTSRVTDLRSATFEGFTPPILDFSHETFVDDELLSAVKGTARASASGVEVAVEEPKVTTLALRRAIFPTSHTRLILEAAESDERVLEATVYDGGDEADAVYETATVIGPGATGLPGATPDERAVLMEIPDVEAMKAWRLVITYFQAGAAEGERQPEYELTFTLLANGVSYNVAFNYGAFSLTGELTELSIIDTPDDAACQ